MSCTGSRYETVGELTTKALADADADVEDVVSYYVAGNTVMTHLFLNITPENIRTSPYIPASSTFPWMSARELGLPGGRTTRLYAMPCPASWLGGDVVAGVTAAGLPWTEKLTLFIDIGTNGELVLGNSEWLVCASCSAGPTFEGGGILHGMRAADGAIEQVRIDDETLEPSFLTIGAMKPKGICGSGLIDCASELFLCGALDRNARFVPERACEYLREGEHGLEYVLAGGDSTAHGRDIVLTEKDIENLMRAKAAIFAGISVLVESMDCDHRRHRRGRHRRRLRPLPGSRASARAWHGARAAHGALRLSRQRVFAGRIARCDVARGAAHGSADRRDDDLPRAVGERGVHGQLRLGAVLPPHRPVAVPVDRGPARRTVMLEGGELRWPSRSHSQARVAPARPRSPR